MYVTVCHVCVYRWPCGTRARDPPRLDAGGLPTARSVAARICLLCPGGHTPAGLNVHFNGDHIQDSQTQLLKVQGSQAFGVICGLAT